MKLPEKRPSFQLPRQSAASTKSAPRAAYGKQSKVKQKLALSGRAGSIKASARKPNRTASSKTRKASAR